jgi:hypothetical protein
MEFEHCFAREGPGICLSNPSAVRGINQDGEQRMHMAFKLFLRRAHRAFDIFVLSSLFLLGAGSVRAEVRFDVFLGYDGTVREATWFPITCEIVNNGPPFQGFIEVSPSSYGKGQTQRLPIELPTGTLKRVVIPTFAPSRYQTPWDVRLVDSRGKVREEVVAVRPQKQVGWETKLIGALPRTAAGMVSLRSTKRDQPDMQPAAARFQTEMFPDNPLVLEGLDAIYLNSETAVALRSSQANALLAWMNAGGHLIVAIEQVNDVTGVPWLRNIMPCEPREIISLAKHGELNDWLHQRSAVTNSTSTSRPARPQRNQPGEASAAGDVVANAFGELISDSVFEAAELRVVAGPNRDGRTVVAAAGTPLIITANRNLGRITVLMFSPEREPFKSWKGLPALWTVLLEVPLTLYTSTDYYPGYGLGADGIFGAMIDSRQVHKLPVGWLLLLLLVYLVVIGPLDRLWLKKINKPMLTWITFPCYVLFFSGLIYFIGYKLRAGDSEYSELHVVDVLPNGERAELRGRTYASIYSPANAKYPMQSALKYATLRGEYLASRGGETSEKAELLHTGDNFKAEVFVPVWTSQLYLSDWWQSSEALLTASLKPGPDGWTLTVENLSGKNIATAKLAVGERIYDVGEIPAGRYLTVALPNSKATALQTFVSSQAGTFHNAAQQRQYAFGSRGSGRIDDLPTASMVASLLGEVGQSRGGISFVTPPGLDVSGAVGRGSAVLLAWAPDSSPVPPLNQAKTKRTAANTLWRLPISIQTQK